MQDLVEGEATDGEREKSQRRLSPRQPKSRENLRLPVARARLIGTAGQWWPPGHLVSPGACALSLSRSLSRVVSTDG